MEKLKNAWTDSNSDIFHNKNVNDIKDFCFQNGIDISKKEIKTFLDGTESGNIKFENVNNKQVSEVSKEFTLRGKFFSQLHTDVIHLSKKMKYNTNMRYLVVLICALSKYTLLAPLFDLKYKSMEKALTSIFQRIKEIYPKFDRFTLYSDGGGEYKSAKVAALTASFGGKMNIISKRPYRQSIGSGIIERANRTVRMFYELEFAENKSLPYLQKLRNVERSLNQRKTYLGVSPEDCLRSRPMDIVMLNRAKKIQRRKHFRNALHEKKKLPIGTIVRIHMLTKKDIPSSVKESYTHKRLSEPYIITDYDTSRELVYYILSDIFLFKRLYGTFSLPELQVVNLDLFQVIAKEEKRLKEIVSYSGEMVIYKAHYNDLNFIANKKIFE